MMPSQMNAQQLDKSFRFLFVALLSLCACDQEEPVASVDDGKFRFVVSDKFMATYPDYVLIISDFEGEVLVTEKINASILHEIEVPELADAVYHVTLFDGKTSFRTFANVPRGEYILDLPDENTGGGVGTHQLFLQDPTMPLPLVTGANLEQARMISREQYELNLNKTSSDIYVLYEKDGEPRFLYYPKGDINKSTTITATDVAKGETMEKKSVTLLQNGETPNITLQGSIEADSRRMEYFLSNSNGAPHVLIPSPLMSRIKFFTTSFVDGIGGYTLVGPEIAQQQKALNASIGNVDVTSSSVFYSVESSGSIVVWYGSSTTIHWDIFSQPGLNVKVNLPELSLEFQNEYQLGNLQELKFWVANVLKDTRYSNFQEYVQSWITYNPRVVTTSYEQFNQRIPL